MEVVAEAHVLVEEVVHGVADDDNEVQVEEVVVRDVVDDSEVQVDVLVEVVEVHEQVEVVVHDEVVGGNMNNNSEVVVVDGPPTRHLPRRQARITTPRKQYLSIRKFRFLRYF